MKADELIIGGIALVLVFVLVGFLGSCSWLIALNTEHMITPADTETFDLENWNSNDTHIWKYVTVPPNKIKHFAQGQWFNVSNKYWNYKEKNHLLTIEKIGIFT